MQVIQTPFEGLKIIKPSVYPDERGYFFESWNQQAFAKAGIDASFVQDNQSCSSKDTLRGMHFQIPPFEQGKLVRVITGRVLDVVVDLRKSQPTFGKYFGVELTASEKNMLWIPPGFAHGFLTLEDNSIFAYKCTGLYSREHERCIHWNDPQLNIQWGCNSPLTSPRDQAAPLFKDFVSPF